MNRKIAFFIDGGYFKKRIEFYHRRHFDTERNPLTPVILKSVLYKLTTKHQHNLKRDELYRIYYYDAPPFDGQYREPVPRNPNENCRTYNFKADQ